MTKKTFSILLMVFAVFVVILDVSLLLAAQNISASTAEPMTEVQSTEAPTTAAPHTVPLTSPTNPPTTTEKAPVVDTLTISFVGDCMFATNHGGFGSGSFNFMAEHQPPTYFLKNFIPLFKADDFTIANCEGVLSDSPDLVEKEVTTEIAFWFKGPTHHAQIFKESGIELASVVNNHSHDFGQQGSDDTVAALESAGVLPGKRNTVSYVMVKGQKLGILCCSLYSAGYTADITPRIREMKNNNCDLIILYFHGGIENESVPEDWKIESCHRLIDAGADIIVGSHPHVLQPMEIYNGKPIIYSLGNFCFGGNIHPPRDTAVYQAVFELRNGQLSERKDIIIPCAVYAGKDNNYQPYIVTDEAKKQEILQFMYAS